MTGLSTTPETRIDGENLVLPLLERSLKELADVYGDKTVATFRQLHDAPEGGLTFSSEQKARDFFIGLSKLITTLKTQYAVFKQQIANKIMTNKHTYTIQVEKGTAHYPDEVYHAATGVQRGDLSNDPIGIIEHAINSFGIKYGNTNNLDRGIQQRIDTYNKDIESYNMTNFLIQLHDTRNEIVKKIKEVPGMIEPISKRNEYVQRVLPSQMPTIKMDQ